MSISKKKLNSTMKFIISHAHPESGSELYDNDIEQLLSLPNAWECIQALSAMGAISYRKSPGSTHIYYLRLLDAGVLYFYNIHEKRIEFIKGFLSGTFSGIVITVVAQLIINLLP